MKTVDDASTPVRSRLVPAGLVVERVLWAVGVGAIAFWAVIYIGGLVGSRQDLRRFDALKAAASREPRALPQPATPDLSLWDPKRIGLWQVALAQPSAAPLAILRIPKLKLEVAVLPGTGDVVLNRAAGHIEDTALPGASGNSGIAAHRDGFFRGLKDISDGDAIEVETIAGRAMYHVERTWIVEPEDVSVLDPTAVPALTLVTCYPFYFVGSAPQRFIVRAVRGDGDVTSASR